MQQFIASIKREASNDFNRRVAEAFSTIGFDDVREQVKRLGKISLQRSGGEDIGDIDVFVIDRSRHVLLAVEVKDFETARTPFELRNEVNKLVGEGSAATHHAERLDFLRHNMSRVLRELRIDDDPSSWEVRGMVVTSADLLATHYIDASQLRADTRVVSLDGLLQLSPRQLIAPRRRRNTTKA
jgi:hypothetical protein